MSTWKDCLVSWEAFQLFGSRSLSSLSFSDKVLQEFQFQCIHQIHASKLLSRLLFQVLSLDLQKHLQGWQILDLDVCFSQRSQRWMNIPLKLKYELQLLHKLNFKTSFIIQLALILRWSINSRKITFPKEHGYAFVISLKTSYHNSN